MHVARRNILFIQCLLMMMPCGVSNYQSIVYVTWSCRMIQLSRDIQRYWQNSVLAWLLISWPLLIISNAHFWFPHLRCMTLILWDSDFCGKSLCTLRHLTFTKDKHKCASCPSQENFTSHLIPLIFWMTNVSYKQIVLYSIGLSK